MRLSVSSAKTWRECRQKYTYRHIEGLRSRGARPVPLERGSIIHELLAGHHTRGSWDAELQERETWWAGLFREEREAYGESLLEECVRVCDGWVRHWASQPMETVLVEEAFDIDLEGFTLNGRIDWLAKDAEGSLWLIEHKTYKSVKPGEAERLSDLQTAVYLRAVAALGYGTPRGVVHDYIRSTPPAIPRRLQSGQLSRAKDVITDRPTLEKAIRDNGLNVADYSTELARASTTTFYERRYLARPPAIVDAALQELYRQVVDMKAGVVYRNISKDCGGCEYNALCEAELFGLDVEFVKKSEYRQRV